MRKITQQSVVKKNLRTRDAKRNTHRERERQRHKEYLYRARFVIAAYEGLKVDWVTIITECLKCTIESLVEGKKSWKGVVQWLTLLVPPVLAIKPKKRGRLEKTPKKATKRRQVLEKHILDSAPLQCADERIL